MTSNLWTIEIVSPKSSWEAEFTDIAVRLAHAFGDTARDIQHIGSTSVPGLPAKDIIDVQVTVVSLDLDSDTERRLSDVGFSLSEETLSDHIPSDAQQPPDAWAKRFARAADGQRRAHVHIRREGAPNERYALLFRDYLRVCPAAAKSYASIKRELAARHPHDKDAYYAIKGPVCDLIIDAAEQWALGNWNMSRKK